MSDKKLSREDCVELLTKKYSELILGGEDRYPRRSDFSEPEVVAIKAFLGPWPRALEAAEIKPAREADVLHIKVQKRIEAKRKQTMAKIAKTEEKK